MKVDLTAEAFEKLLDCLGNDREQAGEKYEDLRRTLTRFFEWRGAPFPEEHADESLNRVSRKLAEGVEIKSINAYCYEVARLVCLESLKGHDSRRASLDEIEPETAAATDARDEAADKELRLVCLEDCLNALPPESCELITEYYRDENRGLIDSRKALAERLGIKRDALANRAQRMRDKLEQCVIRCLRKKLAI